MGEYSVETKNRFQLILEDDVDLYEVLKEEEQKGNQKNAEPLVGSRSMKSAKKVEKFDKPEKSDPKPSDKVDVQSMSDKKNTRRGNENKPPRMRHNDVKKSGDFEKAPTSQEQNLGGFGGRGRSRGGSAGYRGGRGGRGGARRQFDRHSGSDKTGIKAVEKKEGSGSHNWGSEVDSQLDSQQQSADLGERTEGDGQDGTTEQGETSIECVTEEKEPEVNEMTLDEWKAAQAASKTKQQFNVRRAGEGEDPKQWQQVVALEPRKRVESAGEDHEDDEHKVEVTKSALNKLNIEITFSSSSTSRGGGESRGRGGRGRGNRSDRPSRDQTGFDKPGSRSATERHGAGGRAPRGGRGGGFHIKSQSAAPRVDNEMEFPSLGARRA